MQEKVRLRDPQGIEEALNELRRTSLTTAAAGMPPVRATTLNLVAYAGTPATADEMGRLAAALAEQHPSRTILLGTRPGDDAGDWDIWVWARCHPALPGYVVCFEAVQIMAGRQALERLPAVVLSLLRRELPVVLWWPDDVPMGSPLFERLMANADRLVVDSAGAASPLGLLRRLAALGHAGHRECAASDLNWGRLTPWRELTAEFFDPPDCRVCLERLDQVQLEFAGPAGGPGSAQGYLFTAWLATRLGWAPAPTVWSETPGGEKINLLHGQRPVMVELVALQAVNGAQGLYRLTLRGGHPDGRAAFTIRRSAGGGEAEVSTALPNRELRQRVVPFAAPSLTELLGEELKRTGYDPVFEDALRLAAYFSAQRLAPLAQPTQA